MSADVDRFVDDARGMTIASAMSRLGISGLKAAGSAELVGPCPVCGGKDRFSINATENVWNCRGAEGGRDAIGLAAHVLGLNLHDRTGFLEACAAVLGEAVPSGGETDREREAREARLAEHRARAAREAKAKDKAAGDFREKERAKARGKWLHASQRNEAAMRYLTVRLGGLALPTLPMLREISDESYWHGQDERRNPVPIHSGPAMVAPFVDPAGEIIGCHLTWLDAGAQKGRPLLFDEEGEALPSKKMRGTKKGGLIPLVGWAQHGNRIIPLDGCQRLVIGEGIENTLVVALAEEFRADTLYAAAGDLGNLAGPADPARSLTHPTLKTKPDPHGRSRSMKVAGIAPRPGAEREAFPLPAGVQEVLLVGDGDSDPFTTEAAMARAALRVRALGADAEVAMSPAGFDWTDVLCGKAA